MVQIVLLHRPVTLGWSVLQEHIHCLIIYIYYSSTPGDISVTIDGADCAVTSASNTELECVTGPHMGSAVTVVEVEVAGNGIAEEVDIL